MPGQGGGSKTRVRNSCGHDYEYNIKRQSAIKWLEGRPCPSCTRKGKGQFGPDVPPPEKAPEAPEPEAPEPEAPEPEAPKKEKPQMDKVWLAKQTERLPENALFHSVFPDMLSLLDEGMAIWTQGPPGTSKSTLGAQLAVALGLKFYPQSCWPTMPQSALFGFRSPTTGELVRTQLWEAYEHGGLFLLDEIDNGEPSLTAALNSALSNGHCVFAGGVMVEKHPDFHCVATANTAGLGPESGFIGRLGVDLATRDRFVTVQVPIDEKLEAALAHLHNGDDMVSLQQELVRDATARLKKRATKLKAVSVDEILKTIREVRRLVEEQFHGSFVSPRTTIDVTKMTRVGFTLKEAITAKLPGLKQSEVDVLLRRAEVN